MDELPGQLKLNVTHSCLIASASIRTRSWLPTLKFPFPSCVQFVLWTVNAASTNQMLEITSTFLEAETVGLFYKKLWKFPLQTFKAVEIHACCLASASASWNSKRELHISSFSVCFRKKHYKTITCIFQSSFSLCKVITNGNRMTTEEMQKEFPFGFSECTFECRLIQLPASSTMTYKEMNERWIPIALSAAPQWGQPGLFERTKFNICQDVLEPFAFVTAQKYSR